MNDNITPAIINDLYKGWAANKMDILKLQKSVARLDFKLTVLTAAAVAYFVIRYKKKKKLGESKCND